MDAREYLSRKGVALDSDPDRPNTLEEKAWARARDAGHKRPRTGTPHDWEDWERHHDDLAEGAEALEQKIDKDAHRQAGPRNTPADQAAGVQHFTPSPSSSPSSSSPPTSSPSSSSLPGKASAEDEEKASTFMPETLSPSLKAAYTALAVLLPPLAVGLLGGGVRRVVITSVLTLLLWVPGVVYAVTYSNAHLKRR